MLKVAFFRKYFAFFVSPKKVPNHSPEHYPPKEKMLRRVIWLLFFRDLNQNVNSLRLSNL